MAFLQSLRYVSSALRTAENLADEADDLGEQDVATRLRDRVSDLSMQLEAALSRLEEVRPLREQRAHAHKVLQAVYADMTGRIDLLFAPDAASKLTPGGHLDVVERVRYRLRNLPQDGSEAILDVRARLERALSAYDTAVDAYLIACAEAQTRKERVIVEAQALRIELEQVKRRLLLRAQSGSDAWKRIKRKPVRTKRARWVDAARAKALLAEALSVESSSP